MARFYAAFLALLFAAILIADTAQGLTFRSGYCPNRKIAIALKSHLYLRRVRVRGCHSPCKVTRLPYGWNGGAPGQVSAAGGYGCLCPQNRRQCASFRCTVNRGQCWCLR